MWSGKQRLEKVERRESERASPVTADGFLRSGFLVNVAPRGAADQLCESAGFVRRHNRRDAQDRQQPRTRSEKWRLKGRISELFFLTCTCWRFSL